MSDTVINYLGSHTLEQINNHVYGMLNHYKRIAVVVYLGYVSYQILKEDSKGSETDQNYFLFTFYKNKDFNEQWDDFMYKFEYWIETGE